MGQIQYGWHTHAQAHFYQSKCILRGLKNRVKKNPKTVFHKTSFIYLHTRGASLMPLRWHSFISSSISQLPQKHYVMRNHSYHLQFVGRWGETSKLNQNSAQACSLYFKRRLGNPLQSPVSGLSQAQSLSLPILEVSSFHEPTE